MKLIRRLAFPILMLVIVGFLGWLTYANNTTIDQLQSEGKDYNVGLTTVSPSNGKDGDSAYDIAVKNGFKGNQTDWLISLVVAPIKGDQGDPGLTAYQVAQASGYQGSVIDWLISLQGAPGANGADAIVTADQLNLAIANYCFDGRCKGVDGLNGTNGTNGLNGDNAVMACVTRSTNSIDTHYIAWKLSAEPDTSYRDLYKLPVWAECSNPINLKEVI